MVPDAPTPEKAKAVRSIEESVVSAFRDIAESIDDEFYSAYELETDASRLADTVSLDALDEIPSDVADSLEAVYSEGAEIQFSELDITDSSMFDLVHEDARAYAEDRGAELVGRKWVGDKLIDNPDAEWAIDESTRDGLRALIEKAYKDGLSPKDLSKAIQSSYSFSKNRATLIAKTETNKASIEGTLAGWRRSGMVEGKSSLLSDDHDADDECDENESDGVIALDEEFSSGDDGPPYHPGCNCTLVAELIAEGEDI